MREFGVKGCMKAQQDSRNVLNRSRTIYSCKCLDGFERWSAEATFCTPAHTTKMLPLLAGYRELVNTTKVKARKISTSLFNF